MNDSKTCPTRFQLVKYGHGHLRKLVNGDSDLHGNKASVLPLRPSFTLEEVLEIWFENHKWTRVWAGGCPRGQCPKGFWVRKD